MKRLGTFEVGFYDLDHGMVAFEQLADDFPEDVLDMLAIALFSFRQWRNLGSSNIIATESAAMFLAFGAGDLPTAIQSLKHLRRPDDPPLRPMLENKKSKFKLVADGRRAPRRFNGTIEERRKYFSLHSVVKGFGLGGTGLGYYAPAALLMLIDYLASHRSDDGAYLGRLLAVIHQCARLWLSGDVTIPNQGHLATAVVMSVMEGRRNVGQ